MLLTFTYIAVLPDVVKTAGENFLSPQLNGAAEPSTSHLYLSHGAEAPVTQPSRVNVF